MAKSLWNEKNFFEYNGEWLNFHDYGYYGGAVLTVVRIHEHPQIPTRRMKGKIRKEHGEITSLKKGDSGYNDENPDEWMAPQDLQELRELLEGRSMVTNTTEEI